MSVNWRWDQGRVAYLSYENLRKISRCLLGFDGRILDQESDLLLRGSLMANTGLPFAPQDYTVWRNYARVFACSLIATKINNHLTVTELCRRIAGSQDGDFSVDDFLVHWIPRFYVPAPAFSGYSNVAERAFPACATSKYLLAQFMQGNDPSIQTIQVFSRIIGNNCTGCEPLDHYNHLPDTACRPIGDEERQIREMLIFISQASWLKWANGNLVLDIEQGDNESANRLVTFLDPIQNIREVDRETELFSLGSIGDDSVCFLPLYTRVSPDDIMFTEGQKVRVTHLRTERSPQLRRIFLTRYPIPICNMCTSNMRTRYPWSDNLLEVHHLVPLSSSIAISTQGTSIDDVVGLCPNCHRAIHKRYMQYLREWQKPDFTDKAEVLRLYSETKAQVNHGI